MGERSYICVKNWAKAPYSWAKARLESVLGSRIALRRRSEGSESADPGLESEFWGSGIGVLTPENRIFAPNLEICPIPAKSPPQAGKTPPGGDSGRGGEFPPEGVIFPTRAKGPPKPPRLNGALRSRFGLKKWSIRGGPKWPQNGPPGFRAILAKKHGNRFFRVLPLPELLLD